MFRGFLLCTIIKQGIKTFLSESTHHKRCGISGPSRWYFGASYSERIRCLQENPLPKHYPGRNSLRILEDEKYMILRAHLHSLRCGIHALKI